MTADQDTRRDFYVYAYLRDGAPIYIGKGSGKRWVRHASHTGHNRHLHSAIKQDERDCTNRITREKVFEGLTEAEAFAAERELIRRYGREPHGPLFNQTDGGEGAANPSSEVRARASARVSAQLRGHAVSEQTRAKLRQRNLGRKDAPEVIEKRRIANTGKKRAPKFGAAISERNRGNKYSAGRVISDETREKHAAWQRGRKMLPEQVAKAAAANTGKKRSPEQCTAISSRLKGRKQSSEHTAKVAAAQRGVKRGPQAPEVIAKRAAAIKAAWARRRAASAA